MSQIRLQYVKNSYVNKNWEDAGPLLPYAMGLAQAMNCRKWVFGI